MTGERILVVEDNEKNMKLFRDVLVAKGYRTLEATTGGRSTWRLEHRRTCADGYPTPGPRRRQALHRLRENERTATIPRPDRTSDARGRERFLAEGFDGCVEAVNVRELIEIVRQHCEGRLG